MSIKKKQRVFFHLLLFTFFVLIIGGGFDYAAKSAQSEEMVNYAITNSSWEITDANRGFTINSTEIKATGHKLFYRITRDGCQESALQLRLKLTDPILDTTTGQRVRLNVYLGKRRAMIYIPVTKIIAIAGQDSQVQLASFHINKQLQHDLNQNDKISFEVLEPVELAEAMGQVMTFSLNNFDDSQAMLKQLCETELSPRESNYALLRDVL